jgi:iron complex outermembrane recepter protein
MPSLASQRQTHRRSTRDLRACAAAAAAASLALADRGAAAEAANDSTAADAVAVDAIVVTGVRGGVGRTVITSPAPIDVFSAPQLNETGKLGLKEILNTVEPSFNLPGINGGGTSWTVHAYTLRGLNGDQALVLVNGKRRHTTALINNLAAVGNGGVPVDLDLIPVAAIDHIEVLRDGAAAQYGSDAIAGVINIILKTGDHGGASATTIGANYEGDGLTEHEALDYGLKLPNDGFLHLAFDAKHNDAATRAGPTTSTIFGFPTTAAFGASPRDLTANRYFYGESYGPGEEAIYSGAYNAELPLGHNLTLYSFSTLSYRDSTKNTGSFLPNNSDSLPQVYPNGFNALRRIFEPDFQVAVGLRGLLSGWNADLASTFGRDFAYLKGENTINASLGPTSPTSFHLANQIFDQLATTLDLSRNFNIGLATPLTVAFGLEHRFEEYEIQPGDPASYAIGDYIIPSGHYAGQVPALGLASYSGTAPADSGSTNRQNVAAYVDVGAEPVKSWYLDLAGRAEHYTGGPGDTLSGKISTRWEFIPGYAVRATISNGFRAPSLAQDIFASATITGLVCPSSGVLQGAPCVPGQFVTRPTKFLPVNSAAAQALGARTLRPEESNNYSVGFTAQPLHRLSLTVDAYEIDIAHRIVATSNLNLSVANLASSPALSALLTEFPFGFVAQYFTNAVSTTTRGIDVVGAYDVDLRRFGQLDLSASYSYIQTDITDIAATPPQLAAFGLTLYDRQKQANLTVAPPQDKLILVANWSLGKWSVALNETRYGPYTEVNSPTDATLDRTFGAKWITNLEITRTFPDGVELSLGADNLFDVYPDRIGVINAQTGAGPYGNLSPFGITGGYYYGRVTVAL